jgi:hypothetical protein
MRVLFSLHPGKRLTHCPGRNFKGVANGSGRKETGLGG